MISHYLNQDCNEDDPSRRYSNIVNDFNVTAAKEKDNDDNGSKGSNSLFRV